MKPQFSLNLKHRVGEGQAPLVTWATTPTRAWTRGSGSEPGDDPDCNRWFRIKIESDWRRFRTIARWPLSWCDACGPTETVRLWLSFAITNWAKLDNLIPSSLARRISLGFFEGIEPGCSFRPSCSPEMFQTRHVGISWSRELSWLHLHLNKQPAVFLQHMRPARSLEPRLPGEQGNVIVQHGAPSGAVIRCTDLCLPYPDSTNSSLPGTPARPWAPNHRQQSNFSTGWMLTRSTSVVSSVLLFSLHVLCAL